MLSRAQCVCIYFKCLKSILIFSVFCIKVLLKVHGITNLYFGAKNFFLVSKRCCVGVGSCRADGRPLKDFVCFFDSEKAVFLGTLVVA